MDKKKASLAAIIGIILITVLGICVLRYGDQGEQGEIPRNMTTESTVEPIPEQTLESDKQTVLIVEEDGVRDTPAFAAFIDKKITACDAETVDRYIYEYFADYDALYGIHYMAEDLNQDEIKELLIFIEREIGGRGDLLVFEEIETGKLIAWETWEYISNDRQPYIYYCGDGIFMIFSDILHGGLGISVGHYTQKKTSEMLIDYYHTIEELNDDYYTVNIWLRLYENGIVVKEMEYKRYCDMETDEDIIELESAEVREGEDLADEILDALTEEKAVSFGSLNSAEYSEEYEKKVKTVLLEELKKPIVENSGDTIVTESIETDADMPDTNEKEEDRYIYECFRECYVSLSREIPPVFGIHYMAEDLDGDGEDELLAFLQWDTTDGDLLVFHEKDGKLYQWETWDDFLWMRMMDIEYFGNGIFSQGGGAGAIVGCYNTEGKIDYIIKYFRDWGHTEEGEYWKSGHLTLYKEGYEDKELSWEGIYFYDNDSWEMMPENQANKAEFDAIMNGIREELGEGRPIGGVEWEENVKKIPLNELF